MPIVFAVLCISIACWFIMTELRGNMGKATLLKGLASTMFIGLGVWRLVPAPSQYGALILVGLILGMIGDVFLNMRFMYSGSTSNRVFAVGITSFMAGHFVYIAALIMQGAPVIPAAVVAAALSVTSIPPLMKRVNSPSKGLKIFGYVYLAVIICMFSLSAALLGSGGVTAMRVIFTAGAFFFLISDFMMIYYSFVSRIRLLRWANLMCYYVGQLLIAYTIGLI